MWDFESEALEADRGLRFRLSLDSRPAAFADVIHGWQHDAAFRTEFNAALAGATFSAFRWETPCVTEASRSLPFEFVVLDDPNLVRRPDAEAFAEHFGSGASTVTFPNLGGDALLVVPCPLTEMAAYGHLAAFVRLAPEPQRHALWQAVGAAMSKRVGKKPVWLSTAGAGVSWLHLRLDDRPKYYGFAPYRSVKS